VGFFPESPESAPTLYLYITTPSHIYPIPIVTVVLAATLRLLHINRNNTSSSCDLPPGLDVIRAWMSYTQPSHREATLYTP